MLTAFDDTAHRYRGRVYSFARYLLSSREEAEDVTQEVLLRLWRHQPVLRRGGERTLRRAIFATTLNHPGALKWRASRIAFNGSAVPVHRQPSRTAVR